MRRWLILTPLALMFLLIAGAAFADGQPVATPIDPTAEILHYDVQSTVPTGCFLGNLNAVAWNVTGWFTGQEAYKYLFHPWDNCDCQWGFWVGNVHILMNFAPENNYPYEFDCYVDLEDALWDPAVGCWVPGIEDCVSPLFTVTIPQTGLYDIAIPLGEFCDCAFMDYWYFLSFHFPDPMPGVGLIMDDSPTPCTVYNDWGAGWTDLYSTFSEIGNLIMYAEATCCDVPVDGDDDSWGKVKSIFR